MPRRFLPTIAKMLHGMALLAHEQFERRKCAQLFVHVAGVVALLQPAIFMEGGPSISIPCFQSYTEHREVLRAILAPFMELLRLVRFHEKSELMPLFCAKLVLLFHWFLYLQRDAAVAELQPHVDLLAELDALWPDCKAAILVAAMDSSAAPSRAFPLASLVLTLMQFPSRRTAARDTWCSTSSSSLPRPSGRWDR